MNRFLPLLAAVISLSLLSSVAANDNVRAVQTKLKDGGFYFGEIDGAFSSDLSAAMTRFQIRNGLQVSGQLDEETSKALGVTAAVTSTTPEAATTSETWRRLRKSDREFLAKQPSAPTRASQAPTAPSPKATAAPVDDATASPDAEQADPQPSYTAQNRGPAIQPGQSAESVTMSLNTERLRDYVGAFVLAGLDPQVGAELEFFADQVRYYDEGVIGRERVRRSLQSYNEQWPARRFWIAGNVTAEPQSDGRLGVSFPLRYELRNGSKTSSGKVQKSLVLEVVGDDLQIVAVNETKS